MSSIQKTDYLNLHPIPANNINKTIKDTLHQLHTNTPYTPRAYFQITLLYSVLDPDYHISIAMKNLESNPLPNIRITLQTVDISLFLLNSCMYILASISILFLPFFFSDSRKIFTIMPTNQSNNTLLCWSVYQVCEHPKVIPSVSSRVKPTIRIINYLMRDRKIGLVFNLSFQQRQNTDLSQVCPTKVLGEVFGTAGILSPIHRRVPSFAFEFRTNLLNLAQKVDLFLAAITRAKRFNEPPLGNIGNMDFTSSRQRMAARKHCFCTETESPDLLQSDARFENFIIGLDKSLFRPTRGLTTSLYVSCDTLEDKVQRINPEYTSFRGVMGSFYYLRCCTSEMYRPASKEVCSLMLAWSTLVIKQNSLLLYGNTMSKAFINASYLSVTNTMPSALLFIRNPDKGNWKRSEDKKRKSLFFEKVDKKQIDHLKLNLLIDKINVDCN
ncbi:hypothetical protein PHYBLDRAFT_66630 [Phycomyces blakesleeanus NRRL 1555(-)]|uniref:Uncharacterized protein n=1 Tax=Phycomyces blakesleeanus (strain ATCC 8743b / DSM 1359 / FGSC 10004 / NBRC 33097 / NRRL 1555) TaxID=763407 RepID=A0A167L1W3_PHYB8|nr:hypothetical protein PHYBLDRAFT_66630 [Phycomyces blakesleeanus NRRL 1555(-)]OAD69406.1 hypothetical protein PHYBLDRAFT_66630 [Phycomyces blakesleeanus NRRL 1555(-)]|eukprot:XP_018287446.1 hypothetical protein PHYBLDRAFT_66630 [Phycomyces blakesleeanus NRRL 1555(-)]